MSQTDMSGFREILSRDGFCIFRKALTGQEVQMGQSCMSEDSKSVSYPCMSAFVDQVIMKRLNEQTGWESVHVKYRASDNNNSSDAGAMHRDAYLLDEIPSSQAETVVEDISMYTCLSYLDRTVMELVPGSHKKPQMSTYTAFQHYWFHVTTVALEPGDLLLFHSFLLHRGIFTEHLPHRRLVQVFEVFPSERELQSHWPRMRFLTSESSNAKTRDLAKWLYQYRASSSLLNLFSFFNAATGYAPSCSTSSSNPILSPEGTQPRYKDVHPIQRQQLEPNLSKMWETGNQYVLRRPTHSYSPDENWDIRKEKYIVPIGNYIITVALLLLTLIVIIGTCRCLTKPRVENPSFNLSRSSNTSEEKNRIAILGK
jgi:hypothetical protein